MKKNILYIAALLGILSLASCHTEEVPDIAPVETGHLTLTVRATKGVDTKALNLNGNTLNAYWKTGETAAVYFNGTRLGDLTATADENPVTATLSGQLSNTDGLAAGSVIYLLFPGREDKAWDYSGQDGSAPSETGPLATNYDYAMATLTVKDIVDSEINVTTDAIFANQQSIYRFSFKTDAQLSVSSFIVSSTGNQLTRTRIWDNNAWSSVPGPISVTAGSATANPLFVALRNELAGTPTEAQISAREVLDTYSFSVIGSDHKLYLGQQPVKANVLNTQGRFLNANVQVTIAEIPESYDVISDGADAW